MKELTKKDLESFGVTIGKSFELFKKEVREEIKKEKVNEIIKSADNQFILNVKSVYLGKKDLQKEKEFNRELKEVMQKYKVIKCNAELIKNF